MPGRRGTDNIILAHEILDQMGQVCRKRKIGALNVDVENACDTIRWSFLCYCLVCLSISSKAVSRIMTCVCTSSFMAKINGEVTLAFVAGSGQIKGDPLSLYLYIIFGEALLRYLHWLGLVSRISFPKASIRGDRL